jgi:hypothetical protein
MLVTRFQETSDALLHEVCHDDYGNPAGLFILGDQYLRRATSLILNDDFASLLADWDQNAELDVPARPLAIADVSLRPRH